MLEAISTATLCAALVSVTATAIQPVLFSSVTEVFVNTKAETFQHAGGVGPPKLLHGNLRALCRICSQSYASHEDAARVRIV